MEEGRRKTTNKVTIDWMIRETDSRTHEDLKKLALDRKRWRTWNLGPVYKDRKLNKKYSLFNVLLTCFNAMKMSSFY
jgi:riboflavin synthase